MKSSTSVIDEGIKFATFLKSANRLTLEVLYTIHEILHSFNDLTHIRLRFIEVNLEVKKLKVSQDDRSQVSTESHSDKSGPITLDELHDQVYELRLWALAFADAILRTRGKVFQLLNLLCDIGMAPKDVDMGSFKRNRKIKNAGVSGILNKFDQGTLKQIAEHRNVIHHRIKTMSTVFDDEENQVDLPVIANTEKKFADVGDWVNETQEFMKQAQSDLAVLLPSLFEALKKHLSS